MADQQEQQALERKKREGREKLKKGFTTFILLLLALLMVVSLVPGLRSDRASVKGSTTIATIKGGRYDYGPGTPFNYLMNTVQNNIRNQYGDAVKGDQLHQISVLQSANYLRTMALSYAEAKRIGLSPSKDWMRYSLRRLSQNISLANVNSGMRQYIEMEYAVQSLSPQGGDLMSVIAPVTIAELYSYFDLVNYAAQAEVIYLDITNYVESRITEQELSEYYNLNPKAFADSVRIESLAIKSKEGSDEILTLVKTQGWEAAMKKYVENKDPRVIYNPESQVDSKNGAKQYQAVISSSSNNIVTTPILEDKAYHIIHVLGFTTYAQLSDWTKNNLRNDYARLNFERLRAAQNNNIQDIVSKVESNIRNGQSLSQGISGTAFKYFKSTSISPVNQILRDDKQQKIDLPLMENRKWMDFLFTSEPGTVSKTFYTDGYVVMFKILKRGINENIDYAKIDKEIYQRYMYYKNNAVSKDWSDHLQKNFQFKLNEKNIRSLY